MFVDGSPDAAGESNVEELINFGHFLSNIIHKIFITDSIVSKSRVIV